MKKINFVLASTLLFTHFAIAKLHPRDLDGDFTNGHEAVYDDVLNITWLADANLSGQETFGVEGIFASGQMNWTTTMAYMSAMNEGEGYFGYNSWRLPTLFPENGVSIVSRTDPDAGLFDGSSDYGYQISAPISEQYNPFGQSAGEIRNELAYHFYNNFDGIGACYGVGKDLIDCVDSSVYGIANARNKENLALFENIQKLGVAPYYTGVEFGGRTMAFRLGTGEQVHQPQENWIIGPFIWPVLDGDVGTILTDELVQCSVDLEIATDEIIALEDEISILSTALGNCETDKAELEREIRELRSKIDTDADGVPDEIDKCPATKPWQWNVRPDGCHQRQLKFNIP